MLRSRSFRGGDLTLWACWLGLLATFVALCAAVYHRHPLAGDMRFTLWVQDLDRLPLVPQLVQCANAAGDANRVAALATAMFVFLLLRGLRFEAAIVAGVIAIRLLQLAIRETVAWPAGQAEYFLTTRPLPDGGSFLSGHVLGQVLVYGLLFAYAPRITSSKMAVIAMRSFCVLVIALGGPARMYVGAHWPSDVIGSALLAALYLLPVLWLDARRVTRLGVTENAVILSAAKDLAWLAPGDPSPRQTLALHADDLPTRVQHLLHQRLVADDLGVDA